MSVQIDLAIAASHGDYHAAVAALDDGADPNWIDPKTGNSPVLNACKLGHAHIVALLCKRGLDPNRRLTWRSPIDRSLWTDKTALMFARNVDVIETLIGAGANPNQTDADGVTPLMLVCRVGKFELVETLIRNGASVTMESNIGITSASIVYHRTRELNELRCSANADAVDNKVAELSRIASLLESCVESG